MSEQNFQYAKGRYVNPKRIVEVSVYSKQATSPDNEGNYPTTWRVAISLDVKEAEKSTVYSDPFATETDANNFAQKIPLA